MKKKNISEMEEKDFKRLGKAISELTLKGLFWGKKFALALEKERFKVLSQYDLNLFIKIKPNYEKRDFLINVISAISSTYYAAMGNAISHIGQVSLFLKPLWCLRAWRCLRKAEKYSDKFAKMKSAEYMTLGELDTRACVLHKAGRQDEAKWLLSHGIMKILSEQIGTNHDLCLFLIHEAEIISSMKKDDKENKAEANYQQALKLSEDETVSTLTKVRVMKSYGNFLAENKRIDEAESVLSEALDLAEENDLYDQKRKIKAIFKNFKLVIR